MILKFFETEKINIIKNKFILFYGKNEGLKKEEIKKLLKKNINSKQIIFDEKKILENEEDFLMKFCQDHCLMQTSQLL